MAAPLGKSDLLARLREAISEMGLAARDGDGDGLAGERETIRAKWIFGGRKVSYRMSCRLAEEERVLHFREMVSETAWGLPPPAFTVETTTISGWKRSGSRVDRSVGGGGAIDYAQVRDKVEEIATAAGWWFRLEGGRMP